MTFSANFANLLSLTGPAGNTDRLAYDSNGNLVTETAPDGSFRTYAYDSLGQTTQTTDRAGHTVRFVHDAHGLLTEEDLADGSQIHFAYDAHQNQISASGPSGTTTMTYDAADRMTRISYPNGTSLQFTYDAAGQPTTQTDQTGFMEHFVYDALGRLAQVDDGNGHVFVTYTYDAIGRLKSETLADGSVTQYFYDAVGQLVRLLNLGPNGAVLSQFQLAYDALGEVRSVTSNDGVTNYNYDGSGQLISAMLPNGQTISYQYDADGNRISETDASGTTTYQSNVLDQYLTAGSLRFSYDANGNMIRQSGPGGDTAYSYDLLGNLVGITTPTDQYTFTYDALGNRIGSTHNGQTVRELVDPALSQMVAQFNSSGTLIAHYVEAIGPTERIDSSGMTSFYHFDPFGNTGQITDSSGTIQDSYSYLPFGEKSVLRQVTAQPFTFSGQYGVLDDGAGTYFMRNRWYDPRLGRFLQPDPIGISGGDTNLYRYAGNRVPGQVDPGGTDDLSPEEVFQLLQQFNRNKTKFFGLQPIKNPGTWANTMDYKVGTTVRALGQTLQDAGAQSIPPDPGSYGANLPWNQTVSSIRSSINTIQKLLALQGKLKGLGINELPTGPTSGGAPDGSIPVSTVVGDGVKNSLKGIGNTIANSPVVRANAGRVVKIGQVGQVVAVLLDGPTWQALTTNPTDSTNSGVYGNRTIEKKGHDHTFDDRAQAIVNAALHILCDILVGGTAAFLAFVLVPVPGLNFVASVLAGLIAAQLCWFIVHLFSHDPNAIVGPAGYGDSNYVNPAQAMPYTVQFENQSSATAPAQTVTVTEHLDPNLDGSTFQLGDMGFGNFVIHVPAGLSSFSTRVDATATLGVFVDIRAGLDLLTGVITWIFTAIDPTTLDVPLGNPLEGFLPPDDSTGRGEGFVSYFVRPKATDKTGTVINAQATVVFDQNAPINTVQIFNTIDALPPSSSVNPLPAVTNAPTFTVSWSGMDDVGGSGIAYFDVFVSTDNGPFVLFLLATTQTSATFNGSFGHSYAFFSVAADHVGNRQPFPNAAQAITTVGSSAVIATAATGPFTAAEGQTSTVQTLATFTDPAGPQPPASYSVQVDWGDGNGFISDTNVTLAAPVNGVFTVSGSHRYVEEDGLSGQVKVKVMHAGTASNTVSVAVQVSDPAVIAMKVAVNAPAGAPFSGAVATFTDPGGAEANDGTHYTATLNWGDNTPATTGALAVSNGTFTVSGTHTYAAAGSYTISLTINHEGVPTTLQNPVSITTVGLPIPAQMTKPTSWWAGLLGQELIRRLGLTSGGQTVGQWLAMTLPNLYGGSNGAPNLSGFTNAQVAIFYLGLFTQQNTLKLDAQVLATALEVFATTQSLGGTTGQQYGFLVNAAGLGAYNVNIGFNGAAFGVPNSTIQNVYQVLLAANHFAIGGEPWGSNSLLRNEGFSVFLSINGG